jgi:hypothetical protein
MGKRDDKRRKELTDDEDQDDNQRDENLNPYPDQSSGTNDLGDEIGLNLSRLDLKNKNFSDLVTNGKLNREALIEKIKRNQCLFDEHSESLRNQCMNDSYSQMLSGNTKGEKDSQYEDQNAFTVNGKKIETNVMHSRQLADQLIFKGRDNSRRNEKVNSS